MADYADVMVKPTVMELSILQPPEPLWRALSERRCIVFIGAGLSVPAEYPSWGELVSRLIDACVADGAVTEDEAEQLKEHKDLTEAAGLCRRRLNDDHRYYEILDRILTPYGRHRFLPTHLDLLDFEAPAYITTNYDPCLENAELEERDGRRQLRIYPALNLADLYGGHIHHIHGHISNSRTIILTDDDYHQAYSEDQLLPNFLKTVFGGWTVLFIGCGMDDPGIKRILKIAKSETDKAINKAREMGLPEFAMIAHYALLPKEQGQSVSVQDEIFSHYGVQVIRYPKVEHSYGILYETIAAWKRQLAPKVLEEPTLDELRYQR